MIEEIFNNIKSNINYIINSDDTKEIIFEKILKKLSDNGVDILIEYTISEFKENFSKVIFKITLTKDEEKIKKDTEVILSNNNFLENLQRNKKEILELFLFSNFNIKIDITQQEEKITQNQLLYLKDKMKDYNFKETVEEFLEKEKIESIYNLSKQQASMLLNKIQKKKYR